MACHVTLRLGVIHAHVAKSRGLCNCGLPQNERTAAQFCLPPSYRSVLIWRWWPAPVGAAASFWDAARPNDRPSAAMRPGAPVGDAARSFARRLRCDFMISLEDCVELSGLTDPRDR